MLRQREMKPIAELRSVTCHMGSHTHTCHPIYLPRRDGRLSWPWCWLYTEMVCLSADSHLSK